MLTFEQIEKFREQSLGEALQWHKANMGGRLTEELQKAYKAGFEQGYGKAIAAVKLHGGMKKGGF